MYTYIYIYTYIHMHIRITSWVPSVYTPLDPSAFLGSTTEISGVSRSFSDSGHGSIGNSLSTSSIAARWTRLILPFIGLGFKSIIGNICAIDADYSQHRNVRLGEWNSWKAGWSLKDLSLVNPSEWIISPCFFNGHSRKPTWRYFSVIKHS